MGQFDHQVSLPPDQTVDVNIPTVPPAWALFGGGFVITPAAEVGGTAAAGTAVGGAAWRPAAWGLRPQVLLGLVLGEAASKILDLLSDNKPELDNDSPDVDHGDYEDDGYDADIESEIEESDDDDGRPDCNVPRYVGECGESPCNELLEDAGELELDPSAKSCFTYERHTVHGEWCRINTHCETGGIIFYEPPTLDGNSPLGD